MRILLGDTRSKKNLAFMREHGWGRMFATVKPTPQEFEPWGFDNGAFTAWLHGEAFPESIFLVRLDEAIKVNSDPHVAVCPDIVSGGMKSLDFSLHWLRRLPSYWPWYLAVQ